jgi:hypothetical protein
MEKAFKRDLRNYRLYFLLWTVFGLFYFSQGMTQNLIRHDPTPWWRYLIAWLLGAYIWAALTPAILWLGRRSSLERHHWSLWATLHLYIECVVLNPSIGSRRCSDFTVADSPVCRERLLGSP